MIEVKKDDIVQWKVNEYTFTDPQMGIRSISMTVNHPSMWVNGIAPEIPDFTNTYVEYNGETYYISSSKPTAEKSVAKLDYAFTLIFKGAEDELTRRKVRNLALVSPETYVSQGTTFSINATISQFAQLINNNLQNYFGTKWTLSLTVPDGDSVLIDVNNSSIWDLLTKTYEYYGVRFNIKNYTISIGYIPEEISHVFDYGKDGGLVKITRTAQSESIVNRLIGAGGSRNVPMNYFTNRYSDYPSDPNPINDTVNIRNIMPKVFRDSVIAGTLPYIDYVEDLQSIAVNGIREDSLEPNEDIYPTIAGVTIYPQGRIDEIVAVEEITTNNPDEEGYLPTFDIWIKDIGFNLADDQYTSTTDAKIAFTSGMLAGYEFIILAENKVRKVVEDTTKSYSGVPSKYKITLIKSEEELDASGSMLPNVIVKPSPGDTFVIYDIEMPFSYVLNAEQKVQDWLQSSLNELKEEKPTYTIEPMDAFFETAPVEYDGKTIAEKLRAGNKVTINNTKITDGLQTLHINNVTIEYGKSIVPKYTITVTDKVQVQGGTINRMQSQLDAVIMRQLITEKDIDALLSGFSTKFLSKIKPDVAQQLIQFVRGIEIGQYTMGALGGGAAIKMIDGQSYAEVDNLSVRRQATFRELVIESLKAVGGQLIVSGAQMKCARVEELDTYYRCYMDTGDGEAVNEFTVGAQAICQVFSGSGIKYYWRLVIGVGDDYIDLSKIDKSGDGIPEAGDDIVQLGHRTDVSQQNAQIISAVGIDAPSWKQYKGINSYSLEGKETTVFSSLGNKIQGTTVFVHGDTNVYDWAYNTSTESLTQLRKEVVAAQAKYTADVNQLMNSIYLVSMHKDTLFEDSDIVLGTTGTINTLISRIDDILNYIGIAPDDYVYRYNKALSEYFASTQQLDNSLVGAKQAIEAEIKRRADSGTGENPGGGANELREYDLRFDGKYWNNVGFVEVDMDTIQIKKVEFISDDQNTWTDENGNIIVL